ncbi:MAG: hypothetical protein GKR87_16375 [Kiritimatiellae bacterium]|nr:hypothetical protein [Kiritimatiellia bacterium]
MQDNALKKTRQHTGFVSIWIMWCSIGILLIGIYTLLRYDRMVLREHEPVVKTLTQKHRLVIPRYHALIIGINDYQHDTEGMEDLILARVDAVAMAESLEDFRFESTLLLDKEATKNNILEALDHGLNQYGDNDVWLIYFAGHGSWNEKDEGKEGFWIPSDGFKEDNSSWIANADLEWRMKACSARSILLVSDACFSGTLVWGTHEAAHTSDTDITWYQQKLIRPSRFIMASGYLEPVSDMGETHSYFAQAWLDFLNTPHQPYLTATEIAQTILPLVKNSTQQHPAWGRNNMATEGEGEFVFIRKTFDFPKDPQAWDRFDEAELKYQSPHLKDELLQTALWHDAEGRKRSSQSFLRGVADIVDTHGSDQAYLDVVQDLETPPELQVLHLIKLLNKYKDTSTAQDARGTHALAFFW